MTSLNTSSMSSMSKQPESSEEKTPSNIASNASILGTLTTTTIVAIPDDHKKSDARQLVLKLLTHPSRPVKTFFFEWQQDVKLNTVLSKIPFSKDKGNLEEIKLLLKPFFADAAKDAEPSLLDLVATAVSNDIIAIAADADYGEVTKKLNGNSHYLSQATGLSERDKAAADFIEMNIKVSRIGVGRLLLWGAGHFEVNRVYNDCLDQCLISKGLQVKVFSDYARRV